MTKKDERGDLGIISDAILDAAMLARAEPTPKKKKDKSPRAAAKEVRGVHLDLSFGDLGELTERDYDLLRIGVLTTMFVAIEEGDFPKPAGIYVRAFENELKFRTDRVKNS